MEYIVGLVGSPQQSIAPVPTYWDDIMDSLINNQVRTIFAHGPQAVPCNAFALFNGTLDNLLQKPKAYKEQWVVSVKAAMQHKTLHKYGAYLSEQQVMQRWLGLDKKSGSRP